MEASFDDNFKPRFKLDAEGAIANGDIEQLALLLADGIALPRAWEAIGRKNEGSSRRYRGKVAVEPIFKARVKVLTEERIEIETKGGPWAEAKLAARRCWQVARAQNDLAAMNAAARMLYNVTERETAVGGRPANDGDPLRSPGKPPTENPVTELDAASARGRLMRLGLAPQKTA